MLQHLSDHAGEMPAAVFTPEKTTTRDIRRDNQHAAKVERQAQELEREAEQDRIITLVTRANSMRSLSSHEMLLLRQISSGEHHLEEEPHGLPALLSTGADKGFRSSWLQRCDLDALRRWSRTIYLSDPTLYPSEYKKYPYDSLPFVHGFSRT